MRWHDPSRDLPLVALASLYRPHPSSERRTHPSFYAARSPVLYADFANPGMSNPGNVEYLSVEYVDVCRIWSLFW